ncbi:hypothetical protein FQ154_16030 [Paeniglutamicibacter gangotriensis]|uniref:Uncharacterized protein n=1 Tax=Paeniglutamicibacter gangotriensis TaxID=254787 RepID=A0A5B0E8G9_9MICC|nr:hypothetical protein [Paeniglutamicibacter gangotriensis]KAA0974151.1 hypothetical protein FQ154_16030 [Paeniglutamicibacter gangotriensis]
MATLVYGGFALQGEQHRYYAGLSLTLTLLPDAPQSAMRKLVAQMSPHSEEQAAAAGAGIP